MTAASMILTGPQLRVLAELADGTGPLRIVDDCAGRVRARPDRADDRQRTGWRGAIVVHAGGKTTDT